MPVQVQNDRGQINIARNAGNLQWKQKSEEKAIPPLQREIMNLNAEIYDLIRKEP